MSDENGEQVIDYCNRLRTRATKIMIKNPERYKNSRHKHNGFKSSCISGDLELAKQIFEFDIEIDLKMIIIIL